MYRTLVLSFSQLSELFGGTYWSEPTGRSISTLSSRAWPWQLCLMLAWAIFGIQFLQWIQFLCMFILIWILTGEIFNRWRYNDVDTGFMKLLELFFFSALGPEKVARILFFRPMGLKKSILAKQIRNFRDFMSIWRKIWICPCDKRNYFKKCACFRIG